MSNYNLILDLIENNPGKTRFDCPLCRRYNSLAIYNQDGQIGYNCFGASCTLHGSLRQKLSIGDIYARKDKQLPENMEFVCPDYFLQGLSRESVRKYLYSVHCFEACVNGLAEVKYDPRQDRCVFLIRNTKGQLVGAAGRLLGKGTPKWLNYGKLRHPLVCGKKDMAVIVEDPASAVSLAPLVTGIALLGTDLNSLCIGIIKRYRKIVLALDKDAVRKMIKLQREIEYFAENSMILLDDDLKYFDTAAQKEILGAAIDFDTVQDL